MYYVYYDRITDFIFRSDKPEKADMIMIPGSGYGELAIKAAELYHKNLSSKILVSGKFSVLQKNFAGPVSPKEYRDCHFETESDFLKTVLLDHQVKEEDIIQEKNASFTYENAIYSRILLENMGDYEKDMPEKILLVCQAFHGARAGMYFQSVFPKSKILVCPAETQGIKKENWYQSEEGVRTVMGEVERIGTQFTDLILGRDRAEELCRKKSAAQSSGSRS